MTQPAGRGAAGTARSAAAAPVGPVSGTWRVAPGSVAPFRVRATAVGIGHDVVGRTTASLRTRQHPVATSHLTEVATLSRAFTTGAVVTRRAAGFLSLNGTACPVTATISARRDGSHPQVAGSIPAELAYWRIQDPAGAGLLGSLADHGEAEFRLTLHRQ
ncbi:MAG TPA: hypothetical protein VK586_15515 [Streptosporangiaceae bacterium]|nr:hypothetical protein [Streptosporangiaceae bacterium]